MQCYGQEVQCSKRLSDNQTSLFNKNIIIEISNVWWEYILKMMLPGGEYDDVRGCTLFPYHGFYPTGFFHDKVLMRQQEHTNDIHPKRVL